MVHIGTPRYYDEVRNILDGCDSILFEGVDAGAVSMLTRLYGLAANGSRIRLVTQLALDLAPLRARLVHADMTTEEFAIGWRGIAWYRRLAFMAIFPLAFLYFRLFLTRQQLAGYMQLEDLPSREDIMMSDVMEDWKHLVREDRDRVLVSRIEQVHRDRRDEQLTVAVMYGARHMRAVVALLIDKLHYRVAGSRWIQVFDY